MVDIFQTEGLTVKPTTSDSTVEFGSGQIPKATLAGMDSATPGRASDPDPLADPEAAMGGQVSDNPPTGSTNPPTPSLEAGTAMGGDAGLAGPAVSQDEQTPPTQPPAATPLPLGTPRDIFQAEKITPPSVQQINAQALSNGVDTANPQGPEQEKVAAYAKDVQTQNNTIAQARYTPEQLQAWKDKGPIGFWEAWSKLEQPNVPQKYGSGNPFSDFANQLENTFNVANIAGKARAGEPLQPSDHETLNNYLDYHLELNTRGFSFGGQAAQTIGALPAFIASWALTDGVGAAAKSAAASALENAGVTGITKTIATNAASGVARAPFVPALYLPTFAERRLNDAAAVTDKGDLIYKQSQESPAMSALKTFGFTSAQMVGQEFAGPIAEGVAKAAGALSPIAASAVSKLPAVVQESFYTAYKAIQPTAQVSDALSAVGWHGMLGQLGANRVTDALTGAMNLASDKNYTFDDFMKHLNPSPEQWALEAGLVSVAGGVHAATNLGINILAKRGIPQEQAAETMRNMSATERESFVTQNTELPKSTYPELTIANENSVGESQMADLEKQHDALPVDDPQRAVIQQQMNDIADQVTQKYQPIYAEGAIINDQVKAQEAVQPPPIAAPQSGFNKMWSDAADFYKNKIYPELFNDIAPIQALAEKARTAGAEVLPGEDSKLLASFARQTPEWIRRNQMVSTTEWDANGNQVVTGKGLKPIYDDFDNMFMDQEPNWRTRHKDFGDYQIAQTLLEDQKAGRLQITDKQQGMYVDNILRLGEKYGDNFRFFETFAQEARDWDNRILHNLVAGGEWSQEKYDATVGAREKYTSLGRIVEDEGYSPAVSAKGLGQDVNPNRIGALKERSEGSDLEIRDPFLNRMKNSAIIMQKAALNNLRRNMAKFSEFYPDEVKVVEPPIVYKGKGQFTNYFDPKLRDKLQAMIDQFGGTTERTDRVKAKVKGFRNLLGAYDPMENVVHLKLGTTEGTMAHEAGHLLDEKLGLQDKLLATPEMKNELQKLADDRLSSKISLDQTAEGLKFNEEAKKSSGKYEKYIKSDPEVIANFFDSYVNSTDQTRKIAPQVTARFEQILDEDPNLQFIKDIKPSTNRTSETIEKDVYGKATTPGHNQIPFYENGARKFMEVSDPVFKAFNMMSPTKMGIVEKMLGAPFRAAKNILQFGATSTPEFILRHAFRSIGTSFLNTEGRATPLDFMKGMANVVGKSELYKEWASSSGKLNTFMPLDDKSLNKSYTDMFQEKGILDKLNPLNMIHGLKEVGDQSARVGVFAKYKAEGFSDLEAGLMSLEATGNFGRHGSFIKQVNQYAPFFNDMMQGGDRFIRAYARDPAGFTMRAVAAITIPQLMLTGYYLYGADQKTRDEYLEFPSWRRALFSNIKIGDQWVPLPRFFAPGYLFGSLPEQMMVHAYKGYHPEPQNAWLEMLRGAANAVSPIFDWSRAMNPLFKSAIEDITNYNFFGAHSIYPQYESKLPPDQRKNTYTTETAQMMGKIFNFSPAMVDETVQNMAGGMGKYAMQLGDMAIDATRRAEGQTVPAKPSMQLSDIPGVRGFAERAPAGYQSASATEFFNNFDAVSQKHDALKNMDPTERPQFEQDNALDLAQYNSLVSAEHEMSHQNKQIKAIMVNPGMNSEEKTQSIQELEDRITQIAKQANIQYSQAKGNQ